MMQEVHSLLLLIVIGLKIEIQHCSCFHRELNDIPVRKPPLYTHDTGARSKELSVFCSIVCRTFICSRLASYLVTTVQYITKHQTYKNDSRMGRNSLTCSFLCSSWGTTRN